MERGLDLGAHDGTFETPPDDSRAVYDQHPGLALEPPAQEGRGGTVRVSGRVELDVDEVRPGLSHVVVDIEHLVDNRSAHAALAQQWSGEDEHRRQAVAEGGVEADVVHG